MKLLFPAFLGAAVLLAPASSTELVFAPEQGSSLTTTHQRVLELELESVEMTVLVDGEEQEVAESPEVELTVRETESITFTDEYEKVESERILRLLRTFDELATLSAEVRTDADGQAQESETPGESALEETTVVFAWDEAEEEYAVRFSESDEDADEELLEGLVMSADLSGFLPDGEVDEGDTWEIELTAFRRLAAPSGELRILREGEDPEEASAYGEQWEANLEGELAGELGGFREVDGVRLAVVRVTGELETFVEESEDVEEEGGQSRKVQTFRFSFDLEGDLLWDPEQNHAHSLELRGEVEMIWESTESASSGGHELVIRRVLEFDGQVVYDVRVD